MTTSNEHLCVAARAPRRITGFGRLTLATLLTSVSTQACLAQSASPGSTIVIDTIVVEGAAAGVPAFVRDRFFATAGGATLLTAEDIPQSGNPMLARALKGAPGVVVQEFFGGNDQPRIQIRGSGLQQNPVERGILVLRDGLPLNRADGSYIVGLANPLQAPSIEVYRGQTSHRLGATVLGGALNFVSPTGNSAPGTQVQVSGGSFGQVNLSGHTGYRGEGVDALIQGDFSRSDGYRVYNESQRASVSGNVGVALTENIKTRFFIGYTDLSFDVAGPLTKQGLRADPKQVHGGPRVVNGVAGDPGPNVLRDRPQRETKQFFIGNRTTAEFGPHLVDLGLGYTYTDDMFRFPISSGVRVTKGGDFTAVARYAYKPDQAAPLPLFETTAQYVVGSAKRENYLNQGGTRGALFGESDLDDYGLAAGGMGKAERHIVAEQRAAEVGLFARDLDKYPAELSGGMRQRAAVARALAIDPEVVFFDEPFTAVDIGLRRVLQDLVIAASARDGFAALFITHDLAEAIRLAHRIVVLSGRQEGIVAERMLDGAPGERDDRSVFETVQAWAVDPAFADLFDGDRQ